MSSFHSSVCLYFVLRGGRVCNSKICHFDIRVILRQTHLKNSSCMKGVFCSSLSSWKQEIKTPMWKMLSFHQEKRNILHRRSQENYMQIDLVKIIIFLSLSLVFPDCFSFFIVTLKVHVLPFLWISFLYGGNHVT